MPYSGVNDTNLPTNVRKLSEKLRRQWLHVYNSVRSRGYSDGEAIHRANGVIANSKAEGDMDKEIKIAEFTDYEIKSDGDDAGIVEGYASVFGHRDHSKDLVISGAFTKTLAEREKHVVYLPSHDYSVHVKDIPAVPLSIREDAKGLHTTTKFFLNTQAGKDSFEVLKAYQKAGRPLGMSFTFKADDYENTKEGRNLKAVSLFEYGHTALPMHDMARTMSVKSDADIEAEMKKAYSNSMIHTTEVDHPHNHGDMIHSHSHSHEMKDGYYYSSRHEGHDHTEEQMKSLVKDESLSSNDDLIEKKSFIEVVSGAEFKALQDELEAKLGRKLSESSVTQVKSALETLQKLLEQPEDDNDADKTKREIDAYLATIKL